MASQTKTDRDAYIEAYDKYAAIYKDPIEVMFALMTQQVIEPGVRRAAASDLLSYRYPKTKAIDIQANLDSAAGFSFMMVPNAQAQQVIEGESHVIKTITHEGTQYPPDYVDPATEFSREDILG